MIYGEPICKGCKHFNESDFNGLTCKAFPDGIPEEILDGRNDHNKPLKGQKNDVVFEEKEKKKS